MLNAMPDRSDGAERGHEPVNGHATHDLVPVEADDAVERRPPVPRGREREPGPVVFESEHVADPRGAFLSDRVDDEGREVGRRHVPTLHVASVPTWSTGLTRHASPPATCNERRGVRRRGARNLVRSGTARARTRLTTQRSTDRFERHHVERRHIERTPEDRRVSRAAASTARPSRSPLRGGPLGRRAAA